MPVHAQRPLRRLTPCMLLSPPTARMMPGRALRPQYPFSTSPQVYECIAPHLLDVDAALLPIPQVRRHLKAR